MARKRSGIAARKRGSPADGVTAESRVRAARIEKGLSQAELAEAAGLTRQAVYAIESSHYLPNVTTALQPRAHARPPRRGPVRPRAGGRVLEGELLGTETARPRATRAKVWSVGERTLVLPVASLGAGLTYSTPGGRPHRGPGADARAQLAARAACACSSCRTRASCGSRSWSRAAIPPSSSWRSASGSIASPRRVLGWPMGSTAAVEALKRGEVHVAGLHVMDPRSGEANVPFVRRHLGDQPSPS